MSIDWKKTLARVAPAIATALGGPFAGVAVKVAADALGLDAADEDAVAQAVASGDPNVLVKLKEANQRFLLEMRRLDVREDELAVEDRRSARETYARTRSALVPLLAVLVIGGFLAMVYMVLMGITPVQGALAGTLIGYVSAKAEQVIAFYFGSSAGSKEKTEAMAEAMRRAAR